MICNNGCPCVVAPSVGGCTCTILDTSMRKALDRWVLSSACKWMFYAFILGCTDSDRSFKISYKTWTCEDAVALRPDWCFTWNNFRTRYCCESCHKAGVQIQGEEGEFLYMHEYTNYRVNFVYLLPGANTTHLFVCSYFSFSCSLLNYQLMT